MWPTIIAGAIIIAIIVAIVVVMIVNKAKGKTNCSCGCGGCAMKDMCHSKGEKPQDDKDAVEGERANENREPEAPASQGDEKKD
ncbi:MAG: FeoB-associated Cys-rich membrane protein [Clostridia bacterium]|nr:FeoB-associated Cys-rich membrane protein [Clostridia bacterium]